MPAPFIFDILKAIGAGKMMFASDYAINVKVEITKYKMVVRKKSDYEKVMGGTARGVFNLKI